VTAVRSLRPVAVAVLGAVLVWWSGPQALLDGLRALEAGPVLAALGIGVITTVCTAWRWCLVARSLGMRLPLPTAVADCYQAMFLNLVLPAGILGDVHRAVGHGRRTGDVGRGVRAVVLERLAGLVVVAAVAVGALVAHPALLGVVARLVPGGGRPAGLVAGLVAVLVVALGWAFRERLRTAAADVRAVLCGRTGPGVVALSVVALAGYLTTFVVAARASGTTAPVSELLPLLVLSLLVMALPLNVGGFGPREAVAAVVFGAVGLGAGQGLAAAVGYGLLCLVACLPGGAVLLLRLSGRRRARATGTRRTRGRGVPAPPVPSPPTPATAVPPPPTPCTPAAPGSAGAGGRRPRGPLVRTPA
jgi:glycosyltransferase 2 family protein